VECIAVKQFDTTITQRGQVTLPAEVQRVLGVKPREKVTFQVEGNEVRVVPSRFTVESVRGSVPPLKERRSLDRLYQDAGDEYAQRVIDQLDDDQI
jgi:antitoxin PrlF